MRSSEYELATLIDLDRVQRLCDSLSNAFDIALAVLDTDGTVLIATGWQDICTRFHRENAETLSGCLESDLRINKRLIEGLGPSEHYAYRCSNGLWDVAFPLFVAGDHVANIFTGQFFFADDDVDPAVFAERARRLGFDEAAYLEALARVPVISHERLQKAISFLGDFVGVLSEMGLAALRREQKHDELKESEERYRHLFDNANEGLIVFRVERDHEGEIDDLVVVDINPTQARRTRVPRERLVGRRLSECDGSDERLRAYFDVVSGAIAAGQSVSSEVCLRTEDAYELLSTYPAGGDLWALSAVDFTDLREAEQALRRQEEGIRRAYVDVLDAVTGGKLILLTEEELAAELGEPIASAVSFDVGGGARRGAPLRGLGRRAVLPRPHPAHRPAQHRGGGTGQRDQAREGRHLPGLRQWAPPAGRDQRRGPGDRLPHAAPGHARARVLHRRQPRHGLHHHAAAVRARPADHAAGPHRRGARARSGAGAGAEGRARRGSRLSACGVSGSRDPLLRAPPAASRGGRRALRTPRPRRSELCRAPGSSSG